MVIVVAILPPANSYAGEQISHYYPNSRVLLHIVSDAIVPCIMAQEIHLLQEQAK